MGPNDKIYECGACNETALTRDESNDHSRFFACRVLCDGCLNIRNDAPRVFDLLIEMMDRESRNIADEAISRHERYNDHPSTNRGY